MGASTKVLLRLTVVILALTVSVLAESPLVLTIAASDNPVVEGSGEHKPGAPIFLLISLTNRSNSTVPISSFDSDNYIVSVRDESGNLLPEREEIVKVRRARGDPSNPLHDRPTIKGLSGELKAGATAKQSVEISHYYDLSRPGKYIVQVSRRLPEKLGRGIVTSNAITVTVTD